MMALIVALAAFAVVASASLYVGLTVQRKLRDLEENANAQRADYGTLAAAMDQDRKEHQARLTALERAAPTQAPVRQDDAGLVAANVRIDQLVTLAEYGERAAINGSFRYMYPGTVKVDAEHRREVMTLFRAYLATLGAVALLPENHAEPWPRRIKVAYTHGFQTLYGELRANVLRALEEPAGPINALLHAIKRQTSGGVQIGPLVAVRCKGEFVGALLDDESEMDEFHRLKLLNQPDVATAYLTKAPKGPRFDLGQMPPFNEPPGMEDP
jgi:hypothetical protein